MGCPNQIWTGAVTSGGALLVLESPRAFKAASAAPRLLDRVRQALRTRHYSPKTEKSYVAWVRRYVIFHGRRHPSEMGADEVCVFLSYLATETHVSASTQNQALSALLFSYRHVLGGDIGWIDGITPVRRPRRLPVALTLTEVRGFE